MGAFMGIDYASDLDSTSSILVTRRDGYYYVVSAWPSNRTEPSVIADPTVYAGVRAPPKARAHATIP